MYDRTPREFEELVAEIYSARGYYTELQPEGPDDGIDIIATDESEHLGIQAKRYRPDATVSAPTVRRVAGAVTQRDLDRGVIVTTGTFTDPAKQTGSETGVELVNGPLLVQRANAVGVSPN